MVERVIEVVDLIEEHPEVGAVAEDLLPRGAFRHFPSPPYRVIYRLTEQELWIVRIWDTRRDPADLWVPEVPEEPEAVATGLPGGMTGTSS